MMNLTFEHKQQNLLWRFFVAVPPCLRCFWLAFCKIWQKTRLSFSHSLGRWLDFLQCVLLYQDFIAIAITQKEVLLWKMQKFTMKTLIPESEVEIQTKISWKRRIVNNCPRIDYTEKVKHCSKKPFWWWNAKRKCFLITLFCRFTALLPFCVQQRKKRKIQMKFDFLIWDFPCHNPVRNDCKFDSASLR